MSQNVVRFDLGNPNEDLRGPKVIVDKMDPNISRSHSSQALDQKKYNSRGSAKSSTSKNSSSKNPYLTAQKMMLEKQLQKKIQKQNQRS